MEAGIKRNAYTAVETIMCDCSYFHNRSRRRDMRADGERGTSGVKSVLSKHFTGTLKIKESLITYLQPNMQRFTFNRARTRLERLRKFDIV